MEGDSEARNLPYDWRKNGEVLCIQVFTKRKESYRRETPANNPGPRPGRLERNNRSQHRGSFLPSTRRSEQWTVDPVWEMVRLALAQPQDIPGLTTASTMQEQYAPIPMDEGENDSETNQDPSVLEVPAVNWAGYVGVKSIQYVQMGHAPKRAAHGKNNWDL